MNEEDFSERIFALPKMMGWHLDGFGLSLNQELSISSISFSSLHKEVPQVLLFGGR